MKDYPVLVGSNSSFKVIYVRFIKSIPSEMLELDPFQSQPQHKKNPAECYFTQCCISSQHSEKYSVFCGAKKPFSSRYVKIWEDHQTRRKENSLY